LVRRPRYNELERYLISRWEAAAGDIHPDVSAALSGCLYGIVEALGSLTMDTRIRILTSVSEELDGGIEIAKRLALALEPPGQGVSEVSVMNAPPVWPEGGREFLMKFGATVAAFRMNKYPVRDEVLGDLTAIDLYTKAFRDGCSELASPSVGERFNLSFRYEGVCGYLTAS
jgi:hypothetical protein